MFAPPAPEGGEFPEFQTVVPMLHQLLEFQITKSDTDTDKLFNAGSFPDFIPFYPFHIPTIILCRFVIHNLITKFH